MLKIDQGKYRAKLAGKNSPAYNAWTNIQTRIAAKGDRNITYEGCELSDEFKSFQVFAEWFYTNYKEGYHLDKDILVKGNRIYGPGTCTFVPPSLNMILTDHRAKRGPLPQGVTRKTGAGKPYSAALNIKGSRKHLGVFDTPEEAFEEYKKAKERYVRTSALEHFTEGEINEKTLQALLSGEL